MSRINLLYVITKLELGGAQKQLLSLAKGLDRQRFNIFLYTAWDGLLISDFLSLDDVTIIRSRYLERPINLIKDLLALIEIYRFIKKNKIDIVHTHSSKAGILGRLAARLARARIIIHTVHGWSFNDYQPWFLRKIYIALERLACASTDKLIVVSEYDKQIGINNRIGRKDNYTCIRYGIDYQEFKDSKEQDLRGELKINKDSLIVGNISCFKSQKSPQDFIKLAYLVNQVIPNTKFILVGDGFLRCRIEKLINKLNLQDKVILAGWRRDIPRILSTIDVFVLTSLWEGLPITVLEAMAANLAVIATNTGGVGEVILDEDTGFLVSPGDVQGLSRKLINLLRDKNLRKTVGQRAKECLGSNFTVGNMAKNTQDLYDQLITAKWTQYAN